MSRAIMLYLTTIERLIPSSGEDGGLTEWPTSIPKRFFTKNSRKNDSSPAATGVVTHPEAMLPSSLRLIFLTPL